jgi:hypothetical protein
MIIVEATVTVAGFRVCLIPNVVPRSPAVSAPPPTTQAPTAGCPALAVDSVVARCSLAGVQADCAGAPVAVATTASLACRGGYKPRGNHPGSLNTTCTARGQWRPKPISCDIGELNCRVAIRGKRFCVNPSLSFYHQRTLIKTDFANKQ